MFGSKKDYPGGYGCGYGKLDGAAANRVEAAIIPEMRLDEGRMKKKDEGKTLLLTVEAMYAYDSASMPSTAPITAAQRETLRIYKIRRIAVEIANAVLVNVAMEVEESLKFAPAVTNLGVDQFDYASRRVWISSVPQEVLDEAKAILEHLGYLVTFPNKGTCIKATLPTRANVAVLDVAPADDLPPSNL